MQRTAFDRSTCSRPHTNRRTNHPYWRTIDRNDPIPSTHPNPYTNDYRLPMPGPMDNNKCRQLTMDHICAHNLAKRMPMSLQRHSENFINRFYLASIAIWYLQQAVSSSVPSSQSRFPSHSCVFAMHFGVPFGPPRGHKNLLSGQAIAVQFASSLSSEQSWKPSQWNVAGMQSAFWHRNWPP